MGCLAAVMASLALFLAWRARRVSAHGLPCLPATVPLHPACPLPHALQAHQHQHGVP